MSEERYIEIKKAGIYKSQAELLLKLNSTYHKYIYLHTFTDIEKEKKRLLKEL